MLSDFRKGDKLAKAFLRIWKGISQAQCVTKGLQLEKTTDPGLTAEFSQRRWDWEWWEGRMLRGTGGQQVLHLTSHHRSWSHLPSPSKTDISTSRHFRTSESTLTEEYGCSLALWQDGFDFLLNTEKYSTFQIWEETKTGTSFDRIRDTESILPLLAFHNFFLKVHLCMLKMARKSAHLFFPAWPIPRLCWEYTKLIDSIFPILSNPFNIGQM